MSRIINSMVQPRNNTAEEGDAHDEHFGPSESSTWEHLSPKSANSSSESQRAQINLAHLPSNIANTLFRSYMVHISTRWPVMHTPYIRQLHETRGSLTDVYEIAALHLVYAIGGRFLETAGQTGQFHSDQHCEKAMLQLDAIVRMHAGLRSIQILILLSLYNLRSPRGPGAWKFAGLAMRQCIEMGLHRQTHMKWPLIDEMRRRVFWTCYCLDRQVSIILGRPFSISDRDIDVELPTDIDEDIEDESRLRNAQNEARSHPTRTPKSSTSMTGFIHICRLRKIESEIQQTIYRVDKVPSNVKADVESFLVRIDQWKSELPLDAQQLPDFSTMRVDGFDNYMVYYYKCIRFLLYPIIFSPEAADVHYLKRCAQACAGVCQTYKKLHQSVPVGFSVMALHSIFIAGLTLLYCIWAAPNEVFGISTSNGLDSCSIVLYVIAERWVGARKFRDVFDVIKQSVMESIEQEDQPRRSIIDLRRQVIMALCSAGSSEGDCRGEFSAMVNDMAVDKADTMTTESGDDSVLKWQNMAADAPSAEDPDFNFELPMEGMPLFDGMIFAFPGGREDDTTVGTLMDLQQNDWNTVEQQSYSSSI
ncbi:fungal-specific transcription factor domain-containing protein [Stachybotrys elegans]|uniref:Fungal-specific transcription factor domain-containing protein n=1 Tax=Stachybotrys elegans TaxID=80388 RepID=A0A8K0S975_9HYPO|nr:fungal-specific transcription factor domain-containing protein [Stachybotrys elegans]